MVNSAEACPSPLRWTLTTLPSATSSWLMRSAARNSLASQGRKTEAGAGVVSEARAADEPAGKGARVRSTPPLRHEAGDSKMTVELTFAWLIVPRSGSCAGAGRDLKEESQQRGVFMERSIGVVGVGVR